MERIEITKLVILSIESTKHLRTENYRLNDKMVSQDNSYYNLFIK